jgi:hypothetical protein
VLSIERFSEDDQREAQVATASSCLTFEEAPYAKVQGLVAEHILFGSKLATVQGAFAATIHLPQMVFRRLDEAHVVQVDVGFGGWRGGVAPGSGFLMSGFQCVGFVEQIGTLFGFEGDGLLQQLSKVRVRAWSMGQPLRGKHDSVQGHTDQYALAPCHWRLRAAGPSSRKRC